MNILKNTLLTIEYDTFSSPRILPVFNTKSANYSNKKLDCVKCGIGNFFPVWLVLCFFITSCGHRMASHSAKEKATAGTPDHYTAYLFTYFTGNAKEEEAIRFALSNDGYHFRALNNNKPVISSAAISSTGGVRDPHILRGADGKTFYMVATDMVSANGWDSNRAMVLLSSTDLVHWTSAVVNLQKRFSGNDSLLRVWAPQTIYDKKTGKYMIYFSMKHGSEPDKIYYAYANDDFTDLATEPAQLFFSPTNGGAIDGDIVEKGGKFYLFFKTEGNGSGIKIAVSDKLTGGYVLRDPYVQQTKDPVEGAGTFKLNNGEGYILMYDVYTKGRYQFTKTTDLQNFTLIDSEVSMDFHPRHGTVMPITTEEAERLLSAFYSADEVIKTAGNPAIRHINIALDTASRSVTLPVVAGTNLHSFQPQFLQFPGVKVTPQGSADFSRGAVAYSIEVPGHAASKYSVNAVQHNNPLFGGYYADPEVLYAHKTGKFYIYPTSDGFTGWSGTYFKTFSSPDLINWKDEGVILDLPRDVQWGKPQCLGTHHHREKTEGDYQYFYYFSGAQKIGVAVADFPAGPFTDIGKPLVATHPAGIQTVDRK